MSHRVTYYLFYVFKTPWFYANSNGDDRFFLTQGIDDKLYHYLLFGTFSTLSGDARQTSPVSSEYQTSFSS